MIARIASRQARSTVLGTSSSSGQAAGEFRRRVVSAVRRIPPGRVATYGDIAALAGSPRASRAVGNIMRMCGDAGIPCHRVIGAGGSLGGYGGNLQMKRELLRAEGVDVGMGRIRGFERLRWRPTPGRERRESSRSSNGGRASFRG
jgi:methylated-DNA-protein-cysteine methyltransferase-like protein